MAANHEHAHPFPWDWRARPVAPGGSVAYRVADGISSSRDGFRDNYGELDGLVMEKNVSIVPFSRCTILFFRWPEMQEQPYLNLAVPDVTSNCRNFRHDQLSSTTPYKIFHPRVSPFTPPFRMCSHKPAPDDPAQHPKNFEQGPGKSRAR